MEDTTLVGGAAIYMSMASGWVFFDKESPLTAVQRMGVVRLLSGSVSDLGVGFLQM